MTPEDEAALNIARNLTNIGIPVFVAYPDPSHPTGYRLPKSWQTTTANPRYIDAWKPGLALCAVMGHGLDLVDCDPRDGYDPASLNGSMPTVYGVAATPSGGWHGFVATMGVRSHDKVLPGVDVKAGDLDGQGRGFAFIAPTVRASKVTGELVTYRWIRPPDLDALTNSDDRTGDRLADLVRQAHQPQTRHIPDGGDGPKPWDDISGLLRTHGRHQAVYKLACALRGRGGWRHSDALTYMHATVWPKITQIVKDHPYTETEFETDIADAFARHEDGPVTTPNPPPLNPFQPGELDDFWQSRPLLTHLHQFARARRVSPWAMLGNVLVRAAAAIPPFVVLPPLTGSYASVNIYLGVVGSSGAGKDTAAAAAADAVHIGNITTAGVGSGEGIAHQYVTYQKPTKTDPGGLHQHTTSVIFEAAEVDTLAALKGRQASTLLPEFRKAWTGAALGFAYVDKEKRLRLAAHSYRLGLVVGIQPEKAAALLDDSDGGTPQRFLWMPATDPDTPDMPPEEPEPYTFRLRAWPMANPVGKVVLQVCQTARDTIDQARVARLRGNGEALDGHSLLCQLKVAAVLGILDGRADVTEDDWQLADVIMRKSDATRAGVVATLERERKKANTAKAMEEGHRDVIRGQVVEDDEMQRTCKAILRKLKREGDWVAGNVARHAVASTLRHHYAEAVDKLLETGQIEVDDTDRDGTGHGGRGTRLKLTGGV